MFSFLLKSLHSFGRNVLVYFAPIILILVSVNLNVTSSDIYKTSLVQNDFYNKLSLQARQIVNQNEQAKNIIGKNFEFITNSELLKKNTEQNIDSLTAYLSGKGSNNQISNKPPLENLQTLDIISSLKPEQINIFKDSLLQISNLNVSSFLNWQKIPSIQTIRDLIQNFRWQINFLAFLYFLALIIVVLISPLFTKNLFYELGTILSRVGFSTLFGIGIFLSGILITMWSGSLLNQYLLPILNVRPVIELISWQIFWISYNILSFAVYFGGISLGGGYVLRKLTP